MAAPLLIEASNRFAGATVSIEPTGRGLSGFGDAASDAAEVNAVFATRKKVALGSLLGGAGLLLLGGLVAKAPAVKWPALLIGAGGVAYGGWLQMNIETDIQLPWEKGLGL